MVFLLLCVCVFCLSWSGLRSSLTVFYVLLKVLHGSSRAPCVRAVPAGGSCFLGIYALHLPGEADRRRQWDLSRKFSNSFSPQQSEGWWGAWWQETKPIWTLCALPGFKLPSYCGREPYTHTPQQDSLECNQWQSSGWQRSVEHKANLPANFHKSVRQTGSAPPSSRQRDFWTCLPWRKFRHTRGWRSLHVSLQAAHATTSVQHNHDNLQRVKRWRGRSSAASEQVRLYLILQGSSQSGGFWKRGPSPC